MCTDPIGEIIMKINRTAAQPNFGMAMRISPEAYELLSMRVKNPDIPKIDEIVKAQKNNKNVDTFVYTTDYCATKLEAELLDKSAHKVKYMDEKIFHIFRNPLNFLQSVSDKADALEAKILAKATK